MWVLKVKVIFWPWPKVIYLQNFKLAFLRNHWANQIQILYVSFQVQGKKIYWHDASHMTKMAAIYGKNPSKIFFSGTGGSISMKLGM